MMDPGSSSKTEEGRRLHKYFLSYAQKFLNYNEYITIKNYILKLLWENYYHIKFLMIGHFCVHKN
jgi:hypothetical protein